MIRRRQILSLLAGPLALLPLVPQDAVPASLAHYHPAAYAQTTASSALSPQVLRQRGHDLRRDLIAEYKRLRGARLIIYRKSYPDVSALVAKYIPPGISFNDAESILDAAGRWHRKNPPETTPLQPGADGTIGVRILLPTSIFEFGAGYSCWITLVPRVPGEFTTVGEVKASILVDYL